MSGNNQEDLKFSGIAEGEYQLVDIEQLKNQLRASQTALNNLPSPPEEDLPSSQQPIPSPINTPQPSEHIQLPLTINQDDRKPFISQTKSDVQNEDGRLQNQERNNSVSEKRKQIEDVMYSQVEGSKHQEGIEGNSTSRLSREIYGSRFVPPVRQTVQSTCTFRPVTLPQVSISQTVHFGHQGLPQVRHIPPIYSLPHPAPHSTVRIISEDRPARSAVRFVNRSEFNTPPKELPLQKPKELEVLRQQNLETPKKFVYEPVTKFHEQQTVNKVIFAHPVVEKDANDHHHSPQEVKNCQLCRRQKEKKVTELFKSKPRVIKATDNFYEEQWVTATEQRVKQINLSPTKSMKNQRYLASQEKDYYKTNGNLEPVADYLLEGRLKSQFLKGMDTRRQQMSNELSKLERFPVTPDKKGRISASIDSSGLRASQRTRKKIFSIAEMVNKYPHIRIEEPQIKKQQTLTPQREKKVTFHENKTAGRIVKAVQERKQLSSQIRSSKVVNQYLDKNEIAKALISDRIKIFRSKDKSKSPENLKQGASHFQTLRLHQLTPETRHWYDLNKREILFQTEKICSYDLIRRYLSDDQIQNRLNKMLLQRLQPRRWCLTMVDDIYNRLKDRYMTV